MRKESVALYVFIFSVLVLIVLVFSVFKSPIDKVTGRVVENLEEDQESGIRGEGCTDSDGGKNYISKGTVSYCDNDGCSRKEDSCSGETLREWYCVDDKEDSVEYECGGECDEGICISTVTDYKYTSTGGGGGGGGSSGGTISPATTTGTGQIYDLGDLSEQQIELYKYDSMRFNIGSIEHTLTLSDNTPIQVIITDGGQTFALTVGEEHELDLDSDSVSDISIKVKSINIINGKINLILRSI